MRIWTKGEAEHEEGEGDETEDKGEEDIARAE